MAMTYNLNPAPLIPAGNTPQQRYQTGMGLGLVNPFATSTMMPSSPMARTNYLEPTMAAIAARTTQPLQTPTSVAMPTAPLARTSRVPAPLPRPADMPKTPPSGLDQLRAAQLRMPARGTPADAGLRAAASTGLQLSGYQDRPMTLGQGLGAMYGAYTEAEQAAAQRQAEAQRQSFLDQLEVDKLLLQAQRAMQPDPTSIEKNALAMGLERGTPEFNDFIMRAATKPETSVFIGGDEQKKLAYSAALDTRKELKESVASTEAMMPRLMLAMDLLESGVETGRVASALLPVKQWMRSLNLLSDEQIENLTDQELIDSATAALTPAQRVAGSGTTSDRDMNYYQRATVNMANTPEANRVIAAMQIQLNKYNKKRLSLFDDYIQEFGHDFGFGDHADEKLGSFYQRVEDQDQFQQLIDDGLIEEGDVFYNGLSGEFDIFDKEAFQ
jgi:hypothetical protein